GGRSASVSPTGWASFVSRKVVHSLAEVTNPYRMPTSFPRLSKTVKFLAHVFPGEMFLVAEPTARWEGTGGLKVAHLQASPTHFGWDVVLKYSNVPGAPSEPYLPRIQDHTGSVIFFHHKTDSTSRGIGLSHSVN